MPLQSIFFLISWLSVPLCWHRSGRFPSCVVIRTPPTLHVWLMHACQCMLHPFRHVQSFANLRTIAQQSRLSMRFSRQEYCTGLPFPPPEDLPNPGIEPASLMSPALAGGFFTTSATCLPNISPSNLSVLGSHCPSSQSQQREYFFLEFLGKVLIGIHLAWLVR